MILPVLDILAGKVVRGIAGRRHEYRPLEPVCEPLGVARTFRDRFGLTALYLADLDAIAGQAPALALYETLIADGFSLAVDAGLRRTADALPLVRAGVDRVVAGLETLAGPDEVDRLVRTFGPERVVFSLDLRGGEPLAAESWPSRRPLDIVARAVEAGAASVIVLDLLRVGVGQGLGTEDLLVECRRAWPRLELIAGGGVRGPDDLRRLSGIGVDRVLVASALHDGRLTADDVASISQAAGSR